MKIVLDTNVLVAALLSPFGPPARILDAILEGRLRICYDTRILAEYGDVLGRHKFGFESDWITDLLEYLEFYGELVIPAPVRPALPDPADLMFIETALAARADYLVTGNVRHFPARERHGVKVITPAEFVSILAEVEPDEESD